MPFGVGYTLFLAFLLACKGWQMHHKNKVFLRPSTDLDQVAAQKQFLENYLESLKKIQKQEEALLEKRTKAQKRAASQLMSAYAKVPRPGPSKMATLLKIFEEARAAEESKVYQILEIEKAIAGTQSQIENYALVLRNASQRAKNAPLLYGDR